MKDTIDRHAERVRPEFPLLKREFDGRPVVFLDNASTTPKPRSVIDAVVNVLERSTANVHRGVHSLGEEATRLFDEARREVASLIGATPNEIVLVRGTTEAINFVANGLELGPEDEVVFPASEHHANWIPWRVHGKPVPMPIDEDGVPRWETLASLITKKTKLVSIGHVSNVTGAIAPVEEVVRIAHEHGVPVLLDAAQSLSHLPLDVNKLGVDFLAASSHKAFGPSGVGLLWSKKDFLAKCPLYQVGGGMISLNNDIDVGGFIPRDAPFKFEAGTPAIEATIGFGAAVKWMRAIGMDAIREHDIAMSKYLFEGLSDIKGVRVLAKKLPVEKRIALATFVVDAPAMTQESVARALCDMFGVCVSAGFHCTHVLHARTHLPGTVRASPHLFNTTAEIDLLLEGVREIAG
ncbi:Cysteine desulfurase [Labilithrix luteola]|uniref:cysteine desulfurase n=1 Tax=Labilithrix luteola TaxID=1391654 RepID=A0A0K1PSE1_9BACT|nr:cysteine desulfurase [Labilithrix luteola]AKU96276.1 Cysteine desulfurase [Labilithrix luteola]